MTTASKYLYHLAQSLNWLNNSTFSMAQHEKDAAAIYESLPPTERASVEEHLKKHGFDKAAHNAPIIAAEAYRDFDSLTGDKPPEAVAISNLVETVQSAAPRPCGCGAVHAWDCTANPTFSHRKPTGGPGM